MTKSCPCSSKTSKDYNMVKLHKIHPVTGNPCHDYIDDKHPDVKYISISEFVKKFLKEKSSQDMAMGAYANPDSPWFKYSGGVPAILEKWESNKNASCENGTQIHDDLERYHEGPTPELMEKKHIVTFATLMESSFIKRENTFDILEKAFCANLTPTQGIAGTPDWVRYYVSDDKKFIEVEINDYKTDKIIKKTPTFANERSMLGGLAGIPATNYHIYAVKMYIYFLFVQKHLAEEYGIKRDQVKLKSLTIFHWKDENWTVLQLPQYGKQVKLAINEYKSTLSQ